MIWDNLFCQEASTQSVDYFIPCGNPAVTIVYHSREDRLYLMCKGCASHNVLHRSGRLMASEGNTSKDQLVCHLAREVECLVPHGFGFLIPGRLGTYVLDEFYDWAISREGQDYIQLRRCEENEKENEKA